MTRRDQIGISLIELILFVVIVSIGVTAILAVINQTVKSSTDPIIRKQAVALADSILEEILLHAYADPDGSDAGETGRDSYDDVSDYHAQSNSLFNDLPSELASYNIAISITDGTAALGVTAKKIHVTLSRGNDSVSMTGYRASY
jgi:MSHA pilin protein MshD